MYIISHDGSMVLLYVVLHGSHQYTPNVSIYTSTMDPMGMIPFRNLELAVALKIVEKLCLHHESSSVWF